MTLNISTITLFLIATIILCNCNSKLPKKVFNDESEVAAKTFAESPVPSIVINSYLKKISVNNLNEGTGDFEIRVWKSFTHDSFPVILERYFLTEGKLNGEVYFFSANDGTLIANLRTVEDEKMFSFVKKTIGDFPANYVDSLLGPYSLLKIDSLDAKKILRYNESGYVIGMPSKVLLEQATKSKVTSIYITTPTSFAHLDKNIATCSEFLRFTEYKMLYLYPDIKKWYDEQIEKYFLPNESPPN